VSLRHPSTSTSVITSERPPLTTLLSAPDKQVAQAVWAETFKYLADQKVLLEGILLKPSMVTPGAESSKRASPDEVADYTLKLMRRRVPPAVPGAHCFVLLLASHC